MSILNISAVEGAKWNLEKIALRQPSFKIEKEQFGSEWLKNIIQDLFETLYSTPCGIGLAAPQTGIQLQIVVLDYNRDAKKPKVLINPRYEALTDEKVSGSESCLSVPNVIGIVERFKSVVCSYKDFYGNSIQEQLSGFEAKAVQHEIDHINGILYIDRIADPSLILPDGGLLTPKVEKAVSKIIDINSE